MSKDKKVTTVSRGGTQERFGFIKRHGQDLGLSYLCDWLNISRSGYYEWLKLSRSLRALEDEKLSTKIVQIHQNSRGMYGSPRVHQALKKQGIDVGKKRVEHLMPAQRLQGRVVKVTRRQPDLRGNKQRG